MMIDIDQDVALSDALRCRPKAFEAGAVSGNDAVEFVAFFRFLDELFRVKKSEFCRKRILVPAGHFFPRIQQRQGESKFRTDTIAIRPYVADHAECLASLYRLDNPVNDFRVNLHWVGRSSRSPRESPKRGFRVQSTGQSQISSAECT